MITGLMEKVVNERSLPPKILHVFDGFRVGGTEVRTCNVINHLGKRFRHVVVSNNGNFDAARHIEADIDVRYLHPKTTGGFYPKALLSICRALREISPDLMIAYEWGAIDWVLVSRLVGCCPTIMTVEGFEDSELFVQNRRRLLIRRLLYGRCDKVVVCSRTLYDIALEKWKLQPPRLLHIPNGVDCRKFTPSAETRGQTGEVRLGVVASLIKLKNHIKLLKCLAELSESVHFSLHIAGEGPERENLKQFCRESGLDEKVHFLGHVHDTPSFLKGLDIFCLASITEQMPMSVLEAMATGLPIVSTDVGDVKLMVSEENKPFITDLDDDTQYTQALKKLIGDRSLRTVIGRANRHKCLDLYDEQLMFKRYEELYTTCIYAGN